MDEAANFWNQIMPDKFPTAYAFGGVGVQAVSSGANANVPASKMGKPGAFFSVSTVNTGILTGTPFLNSNYYIIMDGASQMQSEANTGNACYGTYEDDSATTKREAVTPVELLALDTKIDDGIANTGSVMSGVIGTAGGGWNQFEQGSTWAGCASNNPPGAGPTYLTDPAHANSYECNPLIRIGTQSGDLQ